jgi:Fe-S-cluster-containing dehydrogenase component
MESEMGWKIKVVRGKTKGEKETDCIRCRGCEAICSFTKEREINPATSRIRVEPRELEWIDKTSDQIVDLKICQQCSGETPCMKACPIDGAIIRDRKGGVVLIDDLKCIRCLKCINACPFQAIWYNTRTKKIIKCDLCGGTPQCVEWCPITVLKLVEFE